MARDQNEDDPTAIRSLAVSAEDVVDAFVYTRENPGTAVLRVTPPFHGRMRARLHVYHVDDARVTGAIHVAPAALLADEVVDAYPAFEDRHDDRLESGAESETGTNTRVNGNVNADADVDENPNADSNSSDAPRERNATRRDRRAALESWRERAREAIVDSVALEADSGGARVDVKRLG